MSQEKHQIINTMYEIDQHIQNINEFEIRDYTKYKDTTEDNKHYWKKYISTMKLRSKSYKVIKMLFNKAIGYTRGANTRPGECESNYDMDKWNFLRTISYPEENGINCLGSTLLIICVAEHFGLLFKYVRIATSAEHIWIQIRDGDTWMNFETTTTQLYHIEQYELVVQPGYAHGEFEIVDTINGAIFLMYENLWLHASGKDVNNDSRLLLKRIAESEMVVIPSRTSNYWRGYVHDCNHPRKWELWMSFITALLSDQNMIKFHTNYQFIYWIIRQSFKCLKSNELNPIIVLHIAKLSTLLQTKYIMKLSKQVVKILTPDDISEMKRDGVYSLVKNDRVYKREHKVEIDKRIGTITSFINQLYKASMERYNTMLSMINKKNTMYGDSTSWCNDLLKQIKIGPVDEYIKLHKLNKCNDSTVVCGCVIEHYLMNNSSYTNAMFHISSGEISNDEIPEIREIFEEELIEKYTNIYNM